MPTATAARTRSAPARAAGFALPHPAATGACSPASVGRASPRAAYRAAAPHDGLVELAAGTRRDGPLHITPAAAATSCPVAGRRDGWRGRCSSSRRTHADRGEEVFIAPAVRSRSRAATSTPCAPPARCGSTSTSPDSYTPVGVPRRAPCHLLVESRQRGRPRLLALDQPLPATRVETQPAGWPSRSSARTCGSIHRLGAERTGKPNVADTAARSARG